MKHCIATAIAGWVIVRVFPVFAEPPQVVLNEVLADPISESTGEFVELYHTGETPVNIADWRLADTADTNDTIVDYTGPHDVGLAGTILPPGGYALVVDPDYAGEYDEALRHYADPALLILVTIRGDRTLGNGLGNAGDVVTLYSPSGASSFAWTRATPPGSVSWEKRRSDNGDGKDNWKLSRAPEGHTPGYRNSVTPARQDAGLTPYIFDIFPPKPEAGRSLAFSVRLRNEGLDRFAEGIVDFYHDDGDGHPTANEHIAGLSAPPVAPDDSTTLTCSWTPQTGCRLAFIAVARIAEDAVPGNDTLYVTLDVSFAENTVAINEIMFDPGSDRPEWVELFNRSNDVVDLTGWKLIVGDTPMPRGMTPDTALPPDGYAIVTEDEAGFRALYPDVSCPVFEPSRWDALRNTGATVSLQDLTGRFMDAVEFASEWSTAPGVSAERLFPGYRNDAVAGWGPSADAGGTPGKRNTLFADRIARQMTVHVTPNPFSPNDDGVEDETVIAVEIPAPYAALTIELYDLSGRRVRALADATLTGAKRSLIWDGQDDLRRRLHIGPYILRVVMTRPQTGEQIVKKQVVVLAEPL